MSSATPTERTELIDKFKREWGVPPGGARWYHPRDVKMSIAEAEKLAERVAAAADRPLAPVITIVARGGVVVAEAWREGRRLA